MNFVVIISFYIRKFVTSDVCGECPSIGLLFCSTLNELCFTCVSPVLNVCKSSDVYRMFPLYDSNEKGLH